MTMITKPEIIHYVQLHVVKTYGSCNNFVLCSPFPLQFFKCYALLNSMCVIFLAFTKSQKHETYYPAFIYV